MKAPVALTLKVIGSSSATVSAGPMPGSTPTAVPRKQPSSAQPRFCSVSACEKPQHLLLQQPGTDVHAQQLDEQEPDRQGQHQRQHQVAQRPARSEGGAD